MLSKRKKLLKILLLCAVLVLLSPLGFYLWLNLRIYSVIDREEYRQLVENINATESLPDRFIEIHGQLTGFNENSTTKRAIFRIILSPDEAPALPCIDLVRFLNLANGSSDEFLDELSIALALDRHTSPRKCLEFFLNNLEFTHSIIGVRNASLYLFQRDLEELTDDEMCRLVGYALKPVFFWWALSNKQHFD